ncbi:Peroxin-3 [Thelonectria olida]|uniref:Peroxin-3 n=1 Tax=Thelonectria olida TaxID=1576542 RepID=A0A9P9AX72_9HYPO|nr:Peroxin-3 [Thelonectria olida]
MFLSTRRWLRNNRTPIAIGVGVIGAGYVATQYVISKINDARERMSSDRIAKENLRRRFEQNQEDCTFTVLALLPSATTAILEAMNTEQITYEIQQMKAAKAVKNGATENATPPSIADTTLTEDDGKSMISASVQSESGIHASQITAPSPFHIGGDGQQDGGVPKARKTKRQLWDDVTISALTRAFSLIYTLALLTMLTRVQLNLLGRRSYLSSVVALATGSQQATISLENNDDDNADEAYGNDFDMNRKYLTFSWWLLNRGWADLSRRVESAVRTVFGNLSPRDLLSFERFSDLMMEVRKLVEGATAEERRKANWLKVLLPPQDQEDEVIRESGILEDTPAQQVNHPSSAAILRRLLDETADLIESPSFSHVLTLLLDSGFSYLVDNKLSTEAFQLPATDGIVTPELKDQQRSKVILLPKILSVLTRQAHVIGNGVPNEYLQRMEAVRALEAFAAVVYSSNWETEIRDDGIMESTIDLGASSSQIKQFSESPVESSIVMVDNAGDFENAWSRAVDQK